MAEYIDRDAIYTAFANACTDVLERASEIYYIAGFSYEHVIEILDNIPAADVAPVVRCKDCNHYKPQKKSAHWENRANYCNRVVTIKVQPDDFCSYGERKDGDGNG